MSLMSSILRGFLGHFTSSVPSEQTRKYHQVRIPFKLILSLIEIIMGPCPPFAPTQLEIPSGFLLHNEYFFYLLQHGHCLMSLSLLLPATPFNFQPIQNIYIVM